MMDEEKIAEQEESVIDEEIEEELVDPEEENDASFEPSPKWKRIGAWIMFVIVVIAVINWLISIAYPNWPQYIMGLLR